MFVTELSPNIISNAFTAVGSKLLKNSDYRQCSSLFATSPQVIHFSSMTFGQKYVHCIHLMGFCKTT